MMAFAVGCLYYVLMCATIQVHVAGGSAMKLPQELFARLKWLTAILWTLYPIIVFVGRAHLAIISHDVEDIALCCVDAMSKLGMEGIIIAHVITHNAKTDGAH